MEGTGRIPGLRKIRCGVRIHHAAWRRIIRAPLIRRFKPPPIEQKAILQWCLLYRIPDKNNICFCHISPNRQEISKYGNFDILTVMRETQPFLRSNREREQNGGKTAIYTLSGGISDSCQAKLFGWFRHLGDLKNLAFSLGDCHGLFFCSFLCIHGYSTREDLFGKLRLHTPRRLQRVKGPSNA